MESLTRHTDYGDEGLSEEQAGSDPCALFTLWLTAAEQAEIYEPNAMVLATIGPDGRPSSRTVLLKGLDQSGLEFVTNYRSRKGLALAQNPQVSAVFPWYALKRQVIVDGTAVPTDAATSTRYFDRRPHGARLAAIASDQSEPIDSRDILDQRMVALEQEYPDGTPVPRPEKWGAYRIVPHRFEFWAGRSKRFHDRFVFTREGDAWTRQRLQP